MRVDGVNARAAFCAPVALFWQSSVDATRCTHVAVEDGRPARMRDLGPEACHDLREEPGGGFSMLARDTDDLSGPLTWVDLDEGGLPIASRLIDPPRGVESRLPSRLPAAGGGSWMLADPGVEPTSTAFLLRLDEAGGVSDRRRVDADLRTHAWAASHGRRWLVWHAQDDTGGTRWHLLEIDDDGPVTDGPVTVELGDLGATVISARRPAAASGGVLWLALPVGTSPASLATTLVAVRPDDGEIISGPHVLERAGSPAVVPTPRGAAMLFADWSDPGRARTGIVRLDCAALEPGPSRPRPPWPG